jgi:hypothetical protein
MGRGTAEILRDILFWLDEDIRKAERNQKREVGHKSRKSKWRSRRIAAMKAQRDELAKKLAALLDNGDAID